MQHRLVVSVVFSDNIAEEQVRETLEQWQEFLPAETTTIVFTAASRCRIPNEPMRLVNNTLPATSVFAKHLANCLYARKHFRTMRAGDAKLFYVLMDADCWFVREGFDQYVFTNHNGVPPPSKTETAASAKKARTLITTANIDIRSAKLVSSYSGAFFTDAKLTQMVTLFFNRMGLAFSSDPDFDVGKLVIGCSFPSSLKVRTVRRCKVDDNQLEEFLNAYGTVHAIY